MCRRRTVGSRKPPPATTHLLKGDPDSATSPSKLFSLFCIPGQEQSPYQKDSEVPSLTLNPSDNEPGFGSSSDDDHKTARRKRLRKRKSRRELTNKSGGEEGTIKDPDLSDNSSVLVTNKYNELSENSSVPVKTINSEEKTKSRPVVKQKKKTKRMSDPSVQAHPKDNFDSKRRLSQRRQTVTDFDLKDVLSKNKIVDKNYNFTTVRETLKRMGEEYKGDKPLQEEDENIDDVEGSLTSASSVRSVVVKKPLPMLPAKPKVSLKGQKFRETVLQLVAKTKAAEARGSNMKTESLPHVDNHRKKYSEVIAAVNKTDEEFEAAIRAMKHIPQPVPNAKKNKVPPTPRLETNIKLGLPPVILPAYSKKTTIPHQFVASFDKHADQEFYRDFRFTFIPLPLPADELPRE